VARRIALISLLVVLVLLLRRLSDDEVDAGVPQWRSMRRIQGELLRKSECLSLFNNEIRIIKMPYPTHPKMTNL